MVSLSKCDLVVAGSILGKGNLSSGSVGSISDLWPGGCGFDSQLWKTLLCSNFFQLAPLMHVTKVVSDFGKKRYVSANGR